MFALIIRFSTIPMYHNGADILRKSVISQKYHIMYIIARSQFNVTRNPIKLDCVGLHKNTPKHSCWVNCNDEAAHRRVSMEAHILVKPAAGKKAQE